MYNLSGKVALVTGAGGQHGIGRAIATRLAKEGADVVLNDVQKTPYQDNNWNGIISVAEEISKLGRKVLPIVSDVSKADEVQNMVNQTIETFGRLDILINNAGAKAGSDRVPLIDLEEDDWDRVQEVNVKGVFLCCKVVAKHLITQGQGGKIINISSMAGTKGIARYASYCASKFAVIGLTESLALELASYRINVNAICPGLVDTERVGHIATATITGELSDQEKRTLLVDKTTASVPMGRIAKVGDVAKTAAFLASSEADYLTGLSVRVSGGV